MFSLSIEICWNSNDNAQFQKQCQIVSTFNSKIVDLKISSMRSIVYKATCTFNKLFKLCTEERHWRCVNKKKQY